MDIKEYRYVYEIFRQGGISRAAKALFISQPSLSAYLKGLEGRLGVSLFEQGDGRLQPTRAGRLYLEHAEQILALDKALMEALDRLRKNKSGRVCIGMAATRLSILLPQLLAACAGEHPDIEIQIKEGTSSQLEEMVCRREVDFILANLPFSRELDHQVLFEEQVVLILPEEFPLCSEARLLPGWPYPWVDAHRLEGVPLALLCPGQRLRQTADRFLGDAGVKPAVFMETKNVETTFLLAQKGYCGCFIYDSYLDAREVQGVRVFCVGQSPVSQQFVLAWPRKVRLSASAAAIRDSVARCLQGFRVGS